MEFWVFMSDKVINRLFISYLHNYYCNYHSGPVPALILEFGLFWTCVWLILAQRTLQPRFERAAVGGEASLGPAQITAARETTNLVDCWLLIIFSNCPSTGLHFVFLYFDVFFAGNWRRLTQLPKSFHILEFRWNRDLCRMRMRLRLFLLSSVVIILVVFWTKR